MCVFDVTVTSLCKAGRRGMRVQRPARPWYAPVPDFKSSSTSNGKTLTKILVCMLLLVSNNFPTMMHISSKCRCF